MEYGFFQPSEHSLCATNRQIQILQMKVLDPAAFSM